MLKPWNHGIFPAEAYEKHWIKKAIKWSKYLKRCTARVRLRCLLAKTFTTHEKNWQKYKQHEQIRWQHIETQAVALYIANILNLSPSAIILQNSNTIPFSNAKSQFLFQIKYSSLFCDRFSIQDENVLIIFHTFIMQSIIWPCQLCYLVIRYSYLSIIPFTLYYVRTWLFVQYSTLWFFFPLRHTICGIKYSSCQLTAKANQGATKMQ